MNLLIQAAEIARMAEMLAPLCDGDEQLFADMIEAETPIDRVLARIHEQLARDGEMLAGIKERAAALAERKVRIEARIAAGKAAIGHVLRAGQLAKFELPECTYSVRDGKPGLSIVDADAVPPELCRTKIEPDKAAINAAFADVDELPNWLAREPAKDVVTARSK